MTTAAFLRGHVAFLPPSVLRRGPRAPVRSCSRSERGPWWGLVPTRSLSAPRAPEKTRGSLLSRALRYSGPSPERSPETSPERFQQPPG